VAQAQALVYRLALTKMGKSGATVAGLRGVTRSLVNRLAVASELPELKKYLNAL
jgi:hypothetical protein